MKVIDLFAGIGGLSIGFMDAGFEIIYANEYDKAIADSYQKNHPGTIVDNRDIGDIDIEKNFKQYKGIVDIVIGGPPCQGFSQKGKRIGLLDERNYLFKKFVEVVNTVKPKYFLLENVPNILTAEGGFFKEEIIKEFSELGYSIDAQILKAEDFGVPQIRRRAFFLGKRGTEKLLLPRGNGLNTTVSEAINDLPRLISGEKIHGIQNKTKSKGKYQKNMRTGTNKIYNHEATNHNDIALERLKFITVDGGKEQLPIEHRTKSVHSGTWTRINPDRYSRTITTRFDTPSSGQFTLRNQDRCITVREAARIQSIPDRIQFYGNKTCQMKQVGNAVPPLIAYEIAKKIYQDITKG